MANKVKEEEKKPTEEEAKPVEEGKTQPDPEDGDTEDGTDPAPDEEDPDEEEDEDEGKTTSAKAKVLAFSSIDAATTALRISNDDNAKLRAENETLRNKVKALKNPDRIKLAARRELAASGHPPVKAVATNMATSERKPTTFAEFVQTHAAISAEGDIEKSSEYYSKYEKEFFPNKK